MSPDEQQKIAPTMQIIISAFVALLALQTVATAQEREVLARFELFNNCQPIGLLVVAPESPSAVSRNAVQALFESRLRAARLYNSEYSPRRNPGPHLAVGVTVSDAGNMLDVGFREVLSDPASGTTVLTTSWSEVRFGGSDDKTLPELAKIMDLFLVESPARE